MTWRGWVIAGLVAVLAVALGLIGRGQDAGLPFDPRGTGPGGTAALVEVLRELGADVEVGRGAPGDDRDVALLLVAGQDQPTQEAVERWVRAGGRLVLADPRSPLNPSPVDEVAAFDLFGSVPLAMTCDHPAFGGIDRVASRGWTAMDPPASADFSCLPMADGAALVGTRLGEGEVVVFGGRGAWTNDSLEHHDNAALAAALVQPASGARAFVLEAPTPGSGDRSLRELVPTRVHLALWQLAVAFGVLAWARSRRHGAPVDEELPTRIRGSEMVAAVGSLLERTGGRHAAAAALQEDLARTLAERLGVPRDASRSTLVQVATARTGLDEAALWGALREREIGDDRQLVALTRSIAAVRARLGVPGTHGPGGSGSPHPRGTRDTNRHDDLSTYRHSEVEEKR